MGKAYIAIDLGAESGRVTALLLDNKQKTFQLHEAHRFSTNTLSLPSGLHWDIGGIWREIIKGLLLSAGWAQENEHQICTVGVDTWGVDWGMIDAHGELIGLPHAYRDPRNTDAYANFTEQISEQEIYQLTGIQLMSINSLYSLFAFTSHSPELAAAAHKMMFIPDLLHYFLSNEVTNEISIASTSQMMDIHSGTWSTRLLEAGEADPDWLSEPILPGTAIGSIRPKVASETGLNKQVQIVAPATHDTASAVAAVPAEPDTNWCFISSGTWSLLGAELKEPCVTEAAEAEMFTNEIGVDGTIRFLKNIAGLWLVQQCRRTFISRGQSYTYEELTDVAKLAEPFRTLINPAHAPFATPGKMLDKINQFAVDSEQPVPETPGDYLRCCLESLALAYRSTLDSLQSVLDRKFDVIHIVGGGGKNELLNQMTADACGVPVIVGPTEATTIGNGLVQAMGMGEIKDLQQLRQIVINTENPVRYEPQQQVQWDAAVQFFASLKS